MIRFRCGTATRTSDGSLVGGDMVAVDGDDQSLSVLVVDLAGNGFWASRLAWRTRSDVDEAARLDPVDALTRLHEVMQSDQGATRGAVAAALRFSSDGLHYAGVGDVRIVRWRSGRARHLPISNGQLGHVLPTMIETVNEVKGGDVYAVVTDGVRTTLGSQLSPGALLQDPDRLASEIIDRWHRADNDATCVVVKAA